MKTTKQFIQEILVTGARAIATSEGYRRKMNQDERLAYSKRIADTAQDAYELRYPEHELTGESEKRQAITWVGRYLEALVNQTDTPRAYADNQTARDQAQIDQDTERATEIEKARAEYEEAKEQERKASHEADNREAEFKRAAEKAGLAHEETQKKGLAYRNAHHRNT